MPGTIAWDASFDASPAGSDYIAEGDDRIRELKVQIELRGNADHFWGDSLARDGYHRQVYLYKAASAPLTSANYGIVYTTEVSGNVELMYKDGAGNIIQLTDNGGHVVTLYDLIHPTNQGDTFFVSAPDTLSTLAKDTNATRYLSNTGTSNNPKWAQVDLTNGVTGILPAANGGTGGGSGTVMSGLGAWAARSTGTTYQAATDGFVTVWIVDSTTGSYATILTDSNASPSTTRGQVGATMTGANQAMGCCPVRKNDYYQVNLVNGGGATCTVYWIPFTYA